MSWPFECEAQPTKVTGFSTPLYLQRYHKVLDILERQHSLRGLSTVIDLGCSECKFLNFVRRMDWVTELVGIDKDPFVVEENQLRCAPTVLDYMKKRQINPLDLYVIVGDATKPNSRLLGMDAATAIELIEHLYPDELERFVQNVFGFMRPKVVILTTPNKEFNARLQDLENKFRHYDHKFEWTRMEFERWCQKVIQEFSSYEVSYFGVGEPPDDNFETGHCSQGAIFVRSRDDENQGFHLGKKIEEDSLKVVAHYTVPLDGKSFEERLSLLCDILLNERSRQSSEWVKKENFSISLSSIHELVRSNKLRPTYEDLRSIIIKKGYSVEQDQVSGVEVVIVPFVEEFEKPEVSWFV